MGISRDSRHKRSATGAKRAYYRKKRAFEKGRQPANTRIGTKRIHLVRTRGGNQKFRALRLESGNFSWGSEGVSRKTRVIVVAYHPSNNELVRTNTLTKSAVVQIDAAPFRQWYEAHYGQPLGRRRQQKTEATEEKKSNSVVKKQAARFAESGKVEGAIEKQFESGRLYAVIASRPGQSGRVDGYILEGDELAFYQRAIRKNHTMPPKTTKTRLLLISDTHTLPPSPSSFNTPYRHPLPPAQILLHAGDITKVGLHSEHTLILEMLKRHPAELKIVIAGNHDITLDEGYYNRPSGQEQQSGENLESPAVIKALYTSHAAVNAGIRYLEEETRTFIVPSTGAKFTVYASPYTPEFCAWAFAYPRKEDRFNPAGDISPGSVSAGTTNSVVPSFPGVDIMLTHGPPMGILDQVVGSGESVGCKHLRRAVERARPALHVFGHIHEGHGARRAEWGDDSVDGVAGSGSGSRLRRVEEIRADRETVMEERSAYVDLTSGSGKPLRRGEETVFVNASVVNVQYQGLNAPWVVDLDLEVGGGDENEMVND
ncbi:ribosomal protein S8e-domain-containing protein [Aspergillus karnatakaensis]|uniref:ribosomal protein S8e-domain-containing protein n=1 Tax=Aspergillus karnatakaensis TaxID=1810916 RepID=UPI003CCD605C